jgi:hypothetical protein
MHCSYSSGVTAPPHSRGSSSPPGRPAAAAPAAWTTPRAGSGPSSEPLQGAAGSEPARPPRLPRACPTSGAGSRDACAPRSSCGTSSCYGAYPGGPAAPSPAWQPLSRNTRLASGWLMYQHGTSPPLTDTALGPATAAAGQGPTVPRGSWHGAPRTEDSYCEKESSVGRVCVTVTHVGSKPPAKRPACRQSRPAPHTAPARLPLARGTFSFHRLGRTPRRTVRTSSPPAAASGGTRSGSSPWPARRMSATSAPPAWSGSASKAESIAYSAALGYDGCGKQVARQEAPPFGGRPGSPTGMVSGRGS